MRIPIELRHQIIKDWENRHKVPTTCPEMAAKYKVSKSTITRIICRYKRTGEIGCGKSPGIKPTSSTPENLKIIAELRKENPSISVREIASKLNLKIRITYRMVQKLKNQEDLTKTEGEGANSECDDDDDASNDKGVDVDSNCQKDFGENEKGGMIGRRYPIELRRQIIADWENRDKVPTTYRQIGAKYNLKIRAVKKIIYRYKRTGVIEYRKATTVPRKPRLSTPENMKIVAELRKENPTISVREIAKQLNLRTRLIYLIIKKLQNQDLVETGGPSSETNLETSDISRDLNTSNVQSGSIDTDPGKDEVPSSPIPDDSGCDWNDNIGDDTGVDSSCHQEDFSEKSDNAKGVCFICDGGGASELDMRFPCPAMTPISPTIDKSVRVLCFLKEILGMGTKNMVTLLGETEGLNPNDWMVSVCSDSGCGGAVDKAFHTWLEIKRLEVDLRKRRQEILERIRKCWKWKGREEEGNQAMLTKRVQEVIKRQVDGKRDLQEGNPWELNVKMEAEDTEDFHDFDDFHVSDEVSDEADRNVVLGSTSTVKTESGDNVQSCRENSRLKGNVEKIKLENSSHTQEPRRVGKGLGTRKAKAKLKPKVIEEPTAQNTTSSSSPEIHASSPTEDKTLHNCQSCPTLEPMDMDKFIAHIGFHSRCPSKCSQCNFYFPRGATDDEQVQKHWEECHPGSDSTSIKSIHVSPMDATGNIWACTRSKCKLQFGSAEERERHEKDDHGMTGSEALLLCSICSAASFHSETEVRLHKAVEHPEESMLSCCYCNSQFEIQSERDKVKFLNLDQLKQHISSAHNEEAPSGKRTTSLVRFLQTCPLCGLVFSYKDFSKLDDHMVREHQQNLYETYTCPICSKRMRNADAWNHTKANHWPDRPRKHICQFCGKGFRTKPTQMIHEKIHTNQESRPYQCELCGSSFAISHYLYIHQKFTHEKHSWPSASQKRKTPDLTRQRVATQPDEN